MTELVRVTPLEYQEKRIVRYYGFMLEPLNQEKLLKMVNESNFQQAPKIWEDSGMIFYQYPAKPLIVIRNGIFFTTREVWEGRTFTHKQIRHQASILLRLLYAHNLAIYHRKAIPKKRFTPYK